MQTSPKFARAVALAALGMTTLSLIPTLAQAQVYGRRTVGRRYSANRNRNSNRRNTSGSASTTGKTTPTKPAVDLKTVLDGLKLTEAQKSKIGIYQAKADAEGKAAYADRTLSSDQFITRMDKIHTDLMASIRGTLTPEQQKQFDTGMSKAK